MKEAEPEKIKLMQKWNIKTPWNEGFHTIFSPEQSECEMSHIYRLNVCKGHSYQLASGELEMLVSLIEGSAVIKSDVFSENMNKLDCFYITGGNTVDILAENDCIFYIGAAPCEGVGKPKFLPFNGEIPLGPLHEIHGDGIFRREVFLMLDDGTPASRLMCGYTFGGDGGWTSWPPHEHTETLEETYCYFDMDEPKIGYQMTYPELGGISACVMHQVNSGNMVNFPYGCHPSVATPGSKNIYLWVLVAKQPSMRKFGVMNFDSMFAK